MFRVPGTRTIFEDEIKVVRFRRILEPSADGGESSERGSKPSEATRKARLLQVYDAGGRMRTIDIADVADIG